MSLIKWNPINNLDKFFEDDFFKFPDFGNLRKMNDLAMDVYEKDGKMIVEMQAAGVDPENLEISVENNFLKISGTREEEKEEKDKNYYSKQIFRGSFERTIPLNKEVDEEGIDAEIENGMLKVILPIKDFEENKGSP